jgi:c(7)-type cytochrome triheme protein
LRTKRPNGAPRAKPLPTGRQVWSSWFGIEIGFILLGGNTIKGGEKMRFGVIILSLFILVAFAVSAFAVGSGKKVEYAGGSAGKVIFDGKSHAEKSKCTDCHTKIYPMKKGPSLTMAEMNAGKSCGTCHNGEKAFKTNDQANCNKCHKK